MNSLPQTFDDEALLSVEQLARLIHKSPASVRSDASRNSRSLPPVCRLPGNKRLLWRRQDVLSWIATFVEPSPGVLSHSPAAVETAKKRGRPRKTESRVQA